MSASPWAATRHPHRVVIPVARLGAALPRFQTPPDVRRVLALAMAIDTVTAAAQARLPREVVVATPDHDVQRCATRLGVDVLSDCDGDTEEAVAESARAVAAAAGWSGATAVVLGALPCLLPNELDAALMSRSERIREYLDLGGLRPTFRADTNGWPVARAGLLHEPIQDVVRRLRKHEFLPGLACDVSTIEGLRIATYVGVGAATAAVLHDNAQLRRAIRATREVFDEVS